MWNWLDKLTELKQQGTSCALVTIVENRGSSPREAGAKMVVLPDGTFFGTIGGGNLEHQALLDAKACLEERAPKRIRYVLCRKLGQCCGGVVEVFMDIMNTEPLAYIFGAGHVGQALARALSGTPFATHLIDDRVEWINADHLPADVARHESSWEAFVEKATWDDERTSAIVMTYSHDRDRNIIEAITKLPARFIGLIGSKNKWLEFQLRLRDKGISPEKLARVRCPIGLDIGGKSPQEVALSIAAELVQLHHQSLRQPRTLRCEERSVVA
ncbi:MAG: xanthine dehydrogenase accessory protein XdhC [Deltaproteobacteria bacterium]|nr:xanthine dehydrogenase accessory protein XdhC [Deltaproteobacteria bacterium]